METALLQFPIITFSIMVQPLEDKVISNKTSRPRAMEVSRDRRQQNWLIMGLHRLDSNKILVITLWWKNAKKIAWWWAIRSLEVQEMDKLWHPLIMASSKISTVEEWEAMGIHILNP
jgi:hypothetical protein